MHPSSRVTGSIEDKAAGWKPWTRDPELCHPTMQSLRLKLEPCPPSQERRSFDGSVDLATLGYRGGSETPEGLSSGGAGLGAEAAGRVSARRSGLWPSGPGPADMVRASWNPGSTTVIGQGGVAGLPARRGQVWGLQGRGAVASGEGSGSTSHRSPGQLLELRLTPAVRKVS